MVEVKTFRALRPTSESVSLVSSLPYDVVSRHEAIEILKRNPDSFLKVVKPEAAISSALKPVYRHCAKMVSKTLQDMIDRKLMIRDAEQCFYLYQQSCHSYQRTGIAACLSTKDYRNGVIRPHEGIQVKTWQERVQHIQLTRAHTGCALIMYRNNPYLEKLVLQAMSVENMIYDFVSDDKIRNRCWKISNKDMIDSLIKAFTNIQNLYIADGHHRVAAAVEVARIEEQKRKKTRKAEDQEFAYFPAVLVSHHQIQIQGYHRLIKNLNGFRADSFLQQLGKGFVITKLNSNIPFLPSKKNEFGMFLEGQWFKLSVKENICRESQKIIDQLDVSILQKQVLDPFFHLDDSQKSEKLDFIGGDNALWQIYKKAGHHHQILFTLHPASVNEVIKVMDKQEIMPPKSTWFEPKLRSGIFIHLF